jgi:hypothetical protein
MSEAMRLADECGTGYPLEDDAIKAAAELRRLHALVAACEPFLKEGETPAERIERERGNTHAITSLYAKERKKNEELLEALKEMLADWEEDPAYGYDSAYKARAVIAKAEGEKE